MNNTLYVYVPVAISGSGKSTLALEMVDKDPGLMIVSEDKIREMVYGKYMYKNNFEDIIHAMAVKCILQALQSGQSVFVDETHLTLRKRDELLADIQCAIRYAKKTGANMLDVYEVKFVALYFKPDSVAIQRRMIETKGFLSPEGWKRVIDDQMSLITVPTREEGFDEVRIVDHATPEQFSAKWFKVQEGYCGADKWCMVPRSGICPKCGSSIWTIELMSIAGSTHISACPHCHKSFCE